MTGRQEDKRTGEKKVQEDKRKEDRKAKGQENKMTIRHEDMRTVGKEDWWI